MKKGKQPKTFGERVKTARTMKGMSQFELAQAIGRKQVSISNMERGDVEPSYEQLKKIASVLDVSTSYLLGEEFPADERETNIIIENAHGNNKTRIEIPGDTDAALVLEILKFMQKGKAVRPGYSIYKPTRL